MLQNVVLVTDNQVIPMASLQQLQQPSFDAFNLQALRTVSVGDVNNVRTHTDVNIGPKYQGTHVKAGNTIVDINNTVEPTVDPVAIATTETATTVVPVVAVVAKG